MENAILKPGDRIQVNGWIMLKGLETGIYAVVNNTYGYALKRVLVNGQLSKKRLLYSRRQIEQWLNPNNDNNIEILKGVTE